MSNIILSATNRLLRSVFGLVLFVGFSLVLFALYIVPGMIQIFTQESSVSVWLMLAPTVGYLLIIANLYLIIRYFDPSTNWINSGLLQGLLVCLIWSLGASLIWGMFVLFGNFNNGLALSLKGLSVSLIFGLIVGFIWGMILSFVGGLRS